VPPLCSLRSVRSWAVPITLRWIKLVEINPTHSDLLKRISTLTFFKIGRGFAVSWKKQWAGPELLLYTEWLQRPQALQPAPNIMNGLRKLFSSVNPFDLSKEWHAGKLSWKAKRKWWKWTTDYAWVGLKKCKTHYCLKAVVKLLGMEWILTWVCGLGSSDAAWSIC